MKQWLFLHADWSPFVAGNVFVRSWPQSNTWFHGPTRVSVPNGISISTAVFCTVHVWQCD